MDKYDYIDSIIEFTTGKTSTNFQDCLRYILKTYYDYKRKHFEMPDFYGGDEKNDGWVIEDAIFYQIFAPTRLKESFKREIQKKFKDDLTGLLEKIVHEGKWNGRINEFIFVVNSFDNNLPQDSERYFDRLVESLKKEYSVNFTYRLVNIDYIRDLMEEIDDIEKLKSLSSRLRTLRFIDPNAITEKMMIELIIEISGNISTKFVGKGSIEDYNRVSSSKKIHINGLDKRKEEIENIISNLDVVEDAVTTINQDILFEDKFERVKKLIITKYEELSKKYNGVELLDLLVQEIQKYTANKRASFIPSKFLIIYIFDKCDIFEKEGETT